jgi:hypothetical protein
LLLLLLLLSLLSLLLPVVAVVAVVDVDVVAAHLLKLFDIRWSCLFNGDHGRFRGDNGFVLLLMAAVGHSLGCVVLACCPRKSDIWLDVCGH